MININFEKPLDAAYELVDSGIRFMHRNRWLNLAASTGIFSSLLLRKVPEDRTEAAGLIGCAWAGALVPLAILSITREKAFESAIEIGDVDTVKAILRGGYKLPKNKIDALLVTALDNGREEIARLIIKNTSEDIQLGVSAKFRKNPQIAEYASVIEKLGSISPFTAIGKYIKGNPPNIIKASEILDQFYGTEISHRLGTVFYLHTMNCLGDDLISGHELLHAAKMIGRENSKSTSLPLIADLFLQKNPQKAREVAELIYWEDERAKIYNNLNEIELTNDFEFAIEIGDFHKAKAMLDQGYMFPEHKIQGYLITALENGSKDIAKIIIDQTKEDILFRIYNRLRNDPITTRYASDVKRLASFPNLIAVTELLEQFDNNGISEDELLQIAKQIGSKNPKSLSLSLIAEFFLGRNPQKAQEVAEFIYWDKERTQIMSALIDKYDPFTLPDSAIPTRNELGNGRSCSIRPRP